MGELKILFQGVCTHFIDVVPEVPHRVVLPDASPFRFGMVSLGTEPSVFYFLMPHFAFLRTYPRIDDQLSVPGVMETGNMYGGARLRVANAIPGGMAYGNFATVTPITDYVANYEWSEDVVLGRNAACYLDLYSGFMEKLDEPNSAQSVTATIGTDGPPLLEVTPFAGGSPQTIALKADESGVAYLLLGNKGVDCERHEVEQNFDFLLHYLTAKTGIPSQLVAPTPGMQTPLRSFTQAELDRSLPKLAQVRFPAQFASRCFGELTVERFAFEEESVLVAPGPLFSEDDTSPACSDTRYP